MMQTRRFWMLPLATIAFVGITTACTAPPASDEATEPTPTEPTDAAEPATETSEVLMLEASSTLEALCEGGDGVLAISFVDEAGYDGQLLGCEADFDTFDAVREASFADINLVAPMMADEVLQLQVGDYVSVMCEGDRVSLAPLLPDNSDGNMTLECF